MKHKRKPERECTAAGACPRPTEAIGGACTRAGSEPTTAGGGKLFTLQRSDREQRGDERERCQWQKTVHAPAERSGTERRSSGASELSHGRKEGLLHEGGNQTSRPCGEGHALAEDVERITELGQLRARVQRAERRAEKAEAAAAAARKAHQKEMKGLTAAVGVPTCLILGIACVLKAVWWTATAPMALLVLLIVWAGW